MIRTAAVEAMLDAHPARIHVFTAPPILRESRASLRRMASCLTRSLDVSTEEALADAYDTAIGGDDSAVGCNMTLLMETSSDPREQIERVLMAADLLRMALRIQH
ncbi:MULTISPECIES: hypothetical protein [Bradyrhizobium]|uniref:Uncharacterized protein n=2 Tax=Bradyrhizobium TaxID=374 RepID=A0ABY0PJR2_9BRAD|nr:MULTISPECIES: hypothetical protein [Bradyrhizobium]SDI54188.1 hypothetical protein SAMN05444163_3079 [Bradyrhizobium ottawaense]SED43273.1 hypothetical protein SAMN05444171_4090 [Bradyrhizobium lablabi]